MFSVGQGHKLLSLFKLCNTMAAFNDPGKEAFLENIEKKCWYLAFSHFFPRCFLPY